MCEDLCTRRSLFGKLEKILIQITSFFKIVARKTKVCCSYFVDLSFDGFHDALCCIQHAYKPSVEFVQHVCC